MTLKEKFELIVGDKIYNYIYSVKCEQIADEFAIEFLEWYELYGKWTEENLTTKELLEQFKKK
jgi:hypothetical protein